MADREKLDHGTRTLVGTGYFSAGETVKEKVV